MRVKLQCQEITKQREAPFSFYEREKSKIKPSESVKNLKNNVIRANPIPKACSVLLLVDPKIEKMARKKRI